MYLCAVGWKYGGCKGCMVQYHEEKACSYTMIDPKYKKAKERGRTKEMRKILKTGKVTRYSGGGGGREYH